MFRNWHQQFFEADGAGGGGGAETPIAAPEGAPALDAGGSENTQPSSVDGAKDILLSNGEEGANNQDGQPAGVPEAYEFKLGEGVAMNEAISSELTAVGKELNITQAGMDKLLTLHNRVMEGVTKQAEERVNADYGECEKQGLTDEVNVKAAGMFIQNYGSREALEALTASGVIFNPHVMKMFQSLAMAVREDKGAGGQPAAQKTDVVDLIYGIK